MTEDQLLAEVTAECDRLGRLWIHIPDSRRIKGQRGFPDLLILGLSELLFMELKSENGDTSADQDMWIWGLEQAGYHVEVCRPSDWESGRIKRWLEAM